MREVEWAGDMQDPLRLQYAPDYEGAHEFIMSLEPGMAISLRRLMHKFYVKDMNELLDMITDTFLKGDLQECYTILYPGTYFMYIARIFDGDEE